MINNMTKKKVADFGKFPPNRNCAHCLGRGEVRDQIVRTFFSHYWTYKKCDKCNGTGKNLWTCISCNEMIHNGDGLWCSNKNCKMYNYVVALANKND